MVFHVNLGPPAEGKLCPECVVAASGFDDIRFQLQDLDRAADGRFLCDFHAAFVEDN